ncbi:Type I secretion system membrane fusion protein PrsE [Methylophilaceae bacterium]|nr:Type I secretion system membrane fusion protein PrsE [Methylophilaceae bacterium]
MNSTAQLHMPEKDASQVIALHDYANDRRSSRMGMLILLIGLGGFLLWAAFAPLDEGVPTDGVVNIEGSHKIIQHFTGGIVSRILVQEGQEVKAGDVLIHLDDTSIQARADEIRQRYLGLLAQESRLRAEKAGARTIIFHPDVLKYQDDPNVRQHMLNQSQLMHARQEALNADIAGLNESIQGQHALIDGYQGVLSSYRSQLSLLNEQMAGIRQLVGEGFAPRNQQNELEQKIAQVHGDIANTEANLLRSRKSILELTQRISARRQMEQKDIDTEMAQVMLAVQADAERSKPIRDELRRIVITSPASGQVVGLQVHTLGAVIQPGQKIMNIVPVGEPLILDARIPPHLIDKIEAGQDADVRFSTFSNSPQLLLEGKVKTVSSDLLTENAGNGELPSSYYLARIAVTPKGMQALGNRVMQPGMPVQIVIRTGERTLLTYLMHPLVKRIAASMKEE